MLRAWLYGLAVVVGAYAVAGAVPGEWSVPARVAGSVWLSAAPAALVASLAAPRFKVPLGLSMAVVTAMVSVSANLAATIVTHADEVGPTGHVASAIFVLLYSSVPAALGALAGWRFSRYSRP
jgi:hypothetical protein